MQAKTCFPYGYREEKCVPLKEILKLSLWEVAQYFNFKLKTVLKGGNYPSIKWTCLSAVKKNIKSQGKIEKKIKSTYL